MTAGLSLHQLSKCFGSVRAVDELSLDIEPGELLVLVGPSGCGKSTTLRLIAGLDVPDAGRVKIGGRDVTALPPAARNVAMVFQTAALFPHMTVAQNLAFGLEARRAGAAEVKERVGRVAEALGLSPFLGRRPSQLSGGERQRVALGRAMVRDPAVYLLDEPLSNLDAPLRVTTRAEIVRQQARLAATMLYVTHDQVEALSMGHRVGVMRDGDLLQVGRPQEVYDRPANTFVARFIGSPPMNLIPADAGDGFVRWTAGAISAAARGAPSRVVLGVRPEHVHVAGSRWSGRTEPNDTFAARLELIEPLGDQTVLTLERDGVRLAARVEPAFQARAGDVVRAWLDEDRVILFDEATGTAL